MPLANGFALQPGMTLRADIILEEQKLWEVLLSPLLAKIAVTPRGRWLGVSQLLPA